MANIYNNFGKNIRILRTSIDRYATQKSFRRLIAKIDRENEIICYIYWIFCFSMTIVLFTEWIRDVNINSRLTLSKQILTRIH